MMRQYLNSTGIAKGSKNHRSRGYDGSRLEKPLYRQGIKEAPQPKKTSTTLIKEAPPTLLELNDVDVASIPHTARLQRC